MSIQSASHETASQRTLVGAARRFLRQSSQHRMAWFWKEGWQPGEREASEDIAAGRTRRFESDLDFLDSLD